MATKIQHRRDTAANWTANNPTLASGEIGVETDTSKLKLGDGVTAWTSLAYYSTTAAAHALGGAEHSADTLANLNSKVSDATLIDTGDSRLSDARTPTAHGLGGAEHSADTLANLNSKISDATLIDTGDARLSDSRTCDNTFDSAATARTNLDVYSTTEVDSKVTGLYDHKGAYDAATNAPDLDTAPSGILKGDAYTVSVAGNFFAESVEVGDVLIADQDNPTLLSHWTRVNKNISFGTTAGTACEGDDARLSDARTPTAHNHVAADVTDFDTEVSNNASVVANTAKVTYPSADSSKLAGIEAGATADQTGAEIKTAYEAELNTNAFTDAEQTKLSGIATAATANDTDANLKARANHTGTQTASTISDFDSAADARISAQKAAANGIATLDAGSKIPSSQLPAIALTDVNVVASEIAQLALTVQEGDVAVRTDENKSYAALNATNATMADWQELLTPTDAVLSVNGFTGAVTVDTDDITEGVNKYVSAAQKTKLDGIETAATADQTGAEIKVAYEAEANTNAFTDAEKTNLGNQSGTNTGDEPDASTTVKGIVELATDGENIANVAVQGNDSRLSNARTPTAHNHTLAEITDSGELAGLKANLAASTDPGATDDSGAGYSVGSRWVNTTLDKEFVCLDSTATAAVWTETTGAGAAGHTIQEEGTPLAARTNLNFIGANVTATDNPGADATDITITSDTSQSLGTVTARRTTALALPASWTTVTFDTEDLESDASVVEHDDTNTERFYARQAGNYLITCNFEFLNTVTNGDRTCQFRLRKNGTTSISTLSCPIAKGTTEFVTRTSTMNLAVDDYVSVEVIDDASGGIDLSANCVVSLTKLDGIQGPTGPAGTNGADGADGDITWQGNWVSQNYTANQAVKYTDGNSYVCHTNTTASQVPTDTGYWDVLAEKGDVGPAGSGQKRIDISVHPHNDDKKNTASATYVSHGRFIWGGSTLLGTPTKIYANSYQGSGNGNVRIYDLTNAAVIAESASITSTSSGNIVDLGTISNITTGQAVWLIETKGDGVGINNISSVSVEF